MASDGWGGAGCTRWAPSLGLQGAQRLLCWVCLLWGAPRSEDSESGCCGRPPPVPGLPAVWTGQWSSALCGWHGSQESERLQDLHPASIPVSPRKDPMEWKLRGVLSGTVFPRVSICQTEGEWLFKCLVQPEKYQTLETVADQHPGRRFQPVCRATRARRGPPGRASGGSPGL